jgi:hypothetical protein
MPEQSRIVFDDFKNFDDSFDKSIKLIGGG